MENKGKRTKRTRGERDQLKADFLQAFEKEWTLTHAARKVGVSVRTVYDWRDGDPDFAEALKLARQAVCDMLEREAIRRAVGKRVNSHNNKKYMSDTLLIFLLKAHDPKRFRDTTVELKGEMTLGLKSIIEKASSGD